MSILFSLLCTLLVHYVSTQEPKCIPKGLCFPQTVEVNPRIVTPNEDGDYTAGDLTECTDDEELCYPKTGTPAECGVRYTTNVSTADGVTLKGSQPWQVYIMNKTNYIGSGVLITDKIVLTIAHKVDQYILSDTAGDLTFYFGLDNPTTLPPATPPASTSKAAKIVVHEDYDNKFFKNDIALVRLATPQLVQYRTDVGLGCLPLDIENFETPAESINDPNCIVGGWGETEFQIKDEGEIHKQVKVPIVSMEKCKESMIKVLTAKGTADYLDEEKELCAGGQAQKDACTQDGGAPLMCLDEESSRYVIAGLVNWGKGCGRQDVYGVYVDVIQYLDWINENVEALSA